MWPCLSKCVTGANVEALKTSVIPSVSSLTPTIYQDVKSQLFLPLLCFHGLQSLDTISPIKYFLSLLLINLD